MTQLQLIGENPRSIEYGESFTYAMTSRKWECAQPETRTSDPSGSQNELLKNIFCGIKIDETIKEDYEQRTEILQNRVIIFGSQIPSGHLIGAYEDSMLIHIPPRQSQVTKVKINEIRKGSIKRIDTSTVE
jgi:hypothetical protein